MPSACILEGSEGVEVPNIQTSSLVRSTPITLHLIIH